MKGYFNAITTKQDFCRSLLIAREAEILENLELHSFHFPFNDDRFVTINKTSFLFTTFS